MTIQLLAGDCRDVLPTLAADSVHCVVCSPPYWNLRDYQTATWSGGDAACDHVAGNARNDERTIRAIDAASGRRANAEAYASDARGAMQFRDTCGKCGAVRIDRQIGLERDPSEYLATMVAVFREIRRVMRPDAVAFVNMGDGYRDKQLLLMPARLALALQSDGWWVRSDIIVAKKNPMPESCRDRPTSAHEHVFLLTKNSRYFFDPDAVREPQSDGTHERFGKNPERSIGTPKATTPGIGIKNNASMDTALKDMVLPNGRNIRNVWDISTEAFGGAHFATMPTSVVERCIRAGTSERGCCAACGKPWGRVTASTLYSSTYGDSRRADVPGSNDVKGNEQSGARGFAERMRRETTTTGWRPGCKCDAGDPVPCVVLDCFAGAGTTLLVADRLQRDAIGIELNVAYTRMAMDRCIADAPLFTSFPPAEDPEESRMADLFAEAAE